MHITECTIKVSDYQEFMDSLPAGSVDLILTDPPYCISKKTGFKSVVNGEKKFRCQYGLWFVGSC